MRFFCKSKDGGPESPVDGYFLIEIKGLFSVALLKFNRGAREAYHTHAFNAWTWFLRGDLVEEDISGETRRYKRSLLPKVTLREKFHRVLANEDSWCFTLRGPWVDYWKEYNPSNNTETRLTHGRVILSERAK